MRYVGGLAISHIPDIKVESGANNLTERFRLSWLRREIDGGLSAARHAEEKHCQSPSKSVKLSPVKGVHERCAGTYYIFRRRAEMRVTSGRRELECEGLACR